MIETKKQTNSYYSHNNPRELLRDMTLAKQETEKKKEIKTYNPYPLDKPFVEPTNWVYKIFNFFSKLFKTT